MPYDEQEAEARRIDQMYDEVDAAIIALFVAAFATGIPQRVSEAGAASKALLWQAYEQTNVWNAEAISGLYGEQNVLSSVTQAAIAADSQARFLSMTRAAAGRIDELVASFQVADARRAALVAGRADLAALGTEALARQMEAKLLQAGITGFVDAAGRRWKLRTYAEMAARVTTMAAELAGVQDRVIAAGGDLVDIVGPLDYPDGCPPSVLNGPYSITGATTEYEGRSIMTLAAAIAHYKVFHPRCRHWLVPVAQPVP